MAPELILNKGHDKLVDFWAMGITLYEMLQGSTPFNSEDGNGGMYTGGGVSAVSADYPSSRSSVKLVSPVASTVSPTATATASSLHNQNEDEATTIRNSFSKIGQAKERLLNGDFVLLKHTSIHCNNFLKLLLQPDPSKRLGAKNIQEMKDHSWFMQRRSNGKGKRNGNVEEENEMEEEKKKKIEKHFSWPRVKRQTFDSPIVTYVRTSTDTSNFFDFSIDATATGTSDVGAPLTQGFRTEESFTKALASLLDVF